MLYPKTPNPVFSVIIFSGDFNVNLVQTVFDGQFAFFGPVIAGLGKHQHITIWFAATKNAISGGPFSPLVHVAVWPIYLNLNFFHIFVVKNVHRKHQPIPKDDAAKFRAFKLISGKTWN